MERSANALADLAKRLETIMPYVTVGCEVCTIDKHFTSKTAKDSIVAALRIVSVLASHYKPCFPVKSGDDIIDECRTIAEEGTNETKGK